MSVNLSDIFGTAAATGPAPSGAMVSMIQPGPGPVETAPAEQVETPPPGVYYDIPAHVYHQWEAVSSTLLKNYKKLPATARNPYQAGDDANVGSGIHALTLQGDAGLALECAVMPAECEGKGEPAKNARALFQSLHPGKVPLPPVYGPLKIKVMEVLEGVDTSFRTHLKTKEILSNSQKEVSLVWIDEETGLLCKARLDIWDGSIIWDIKKTRSIDSFPWQAKDLCYDVQAGWYFYGAQACGLNPVAFGFLPCEAYPPYRVDCIYRDPDKLTADVDESKRLLRLVMESQLTNNWPIYRIPGHIFSLADIQPDDLISIW